MRPIAVIRPMFSRRPTGIGIAGDAIVDVLPMGAGRTSSRLDRWFAAINDGVLPGPFRALARVGLAQLAPFFFSRTDRLLFASHHAPVWRTGRHAVVLYDTIPLQFPAQAPGQASYYRRWLPRVVRCAERLVTISASVREEYVVRGYLAARSASVIPAWSPGVTQGSARDAESRAERELLVVGARYPHKNIDVVLRALELLNSEATTPWCLTLAGADRRLWGRAWGGLEYFETRGWVRTIERVSPQELAGLYEHSTVLIYPSLAEGQGLPPLEAMAAGCPTICSDIPVLRETCGDAALYFPAQDGEALARLIVDGVEQVAPAERVARIVAARERLQQFSREALAARWRAFLEEWP